MLKRDGPGHQWRERSDGVNPGDPGGPGGVGDPRTRGRQRVSEYSHGVRRKRRGRRGMAQATSLMTTPGSMVAEQAGLGGFGRSGHGKGGDGHYLRFGSSEGYFCRWWRWWRWECLFYPLSRWETTPLETWFLVTERPGSAARAERPRQGQGRPPSLARQGRKLRLTRRERRGRRLLQRRPRWKRWKRRGRNGSRGGQCGNRQRCGYGYGDRR